MTIVLPAHWSSESAVKRLGHSDLLVSSQKDAGVCGGVQSKSKISIYSRDIHPAGEDLEEFHFGRVSANQRQNIEVHLHECDSCRGLLEDLREFIVALSNAIEPTVPEGLEMQRQAQKDNNTIDINESDCSGMTRERGRARTPMRAAVPQASSCPAPQSDSSPWTLASETAIP
jgi:hypothetical protein